MGKKMIFHVICAIVGALIYFLFFDDALIIDIIVFVSVYLLFSLLIEFILSKSRSNRRSKTDEVADNFVQKNTRIAGFIEAIGGSVNILSTDFEASRVKIELRNISLIDPEKLKEYALDGAYLAGSQLQITVGSNFGVTPAEFSNQIRIAIESNR